MREIADEVARVVRAAQRFVRMDVFLFNLHHTAGKSFIPTTRQLAEAFAESGASGFFITDPLNTTYGIEHNEAFDWLEQVRGSAAVIAEHLGEGRITLFMFYGQS